MYPKITIDYGKCQTPFDCNVCLQICPQAVFDLNTLKYIRLQQTDKKEPGAYKVTPVYRDRCSGCGDCVEVCPIDAITIVYPEVAKQ
jgi:NADH-quinone oxidoreductase subunit I